MSSATETHHASAASVTARDIENVERSLVDASARTPVLFFYTTAMTWLILATALGFLASIKLHRPDFLTSCKYLKIIGDSSWFTYGRLWPAYMNALTYGWGCMVGLGTGIWLAARLCRVTFRSTKLLVWGGILWNIGVTCGLTNILTGNGGAFEFMEFPRGVAMILFTAYTMIAVWGVVMFRLRRPGRAYISLSYLFAGFLWFPWLYAAGYLAVSVFHAPGVIPAVVNAWFAQGLLGLWFGSIGLAAVYYFIPKVTGKPMHSYNLASIGFWSYALIFGWTGMTRLSGGPVPAWTVTASIAATILMLIPIATVTVNYAFTMRGALHTVHTSPTIRFVFFGAVAWSVSGIVALIGSLRSVDRITHFTTWGSGWTHMMLYAFFTMTMFGSMYYVVPRLVGCEWLSSTFIRLHFWGCAYGIGFTCALLLVGGLAQGAAWADPGQNPVDAIKPFLVGRTIAWLLLIGGHVVFALHYLLMLLRLGRPGGEPTLLGHTEEHA